MRLTGEGEIIRRMNICTKRCSRAKSVVMFGLFCSCMFLMLVIMLVLMILKLVLVLML
jgi:hypothetical protein